MVEAGYDDFIAGADLASNGPADGEGQRSHVGTEHDLVGRGRVQQVSHGLMRLVDDGVATVSRRKCATAVGVAVSQIVSHGVDDALRDLRAAGVVEEDGGLAIDLLPQRRKSGTNECVFKRERHV